MTIHTDIDKAHALYAFSSAHRWIACTASADAISRLPPQEEGEAAKKGTAAHSELERCLGPLNGEFVDPATMAIKEIDPDHPSAHSVALMIAFVRKLPPGRMWVEQRVVLNKDIWGTADIQHWHEESATLTIPDLKDGFVGVDADAEQLRGYAAASIKTHNLPARWVRTVVCQPNDFRPVPRVKQAIESAAKLMKWAEEVAAIPTGLKKFVVGEQCTYCPLFGKCEASRDILQNVGTLVAGLMSPSDVTPEQRALFKACEKPIKDAFANAEKTWLKEALAKGAPEGLGVFTATKHRTWLNEQAARAAIVAAKGTDALKLPTPAQAEDMGIDITGLADKPEGGPVLGFANDKRKPWVARSAAEMFRGIPGLNNAATSC